MSLVFFLFVLVLQNPNLEFVQLYLVPVISLLCMDCRLFKLIYSALWLQIIFQRNPNTNYNTNLVEFTAEVFN